jgi:transposase
LVDDALQRHSTKSDMAKAIAYSAKRWAMLTCFLDDGRLEIDNNIAERAMRSLVDGRPNWLFAGSKIGGTRAAAIYSVIETCKMNGINPQPYIADVIAQIATDWPASRWDELIPWNWQPEQPQIAMAA